MFANFSYLKTLCQRVEYFYIIDCYIIVKKNYKLMLCENYYYVYIFSNKWQVVVMLLTEKGNLYPANILIYFHTRYQIYIIYVIENNILFKKIPFPDFLKLSFNL